MVIKAPKGRNSPFPHLGKANSTPMVFRVASLVTP